MSNNCTLVGPDHRHENRSPPLVRLFHAFYPLLWQLWLLCLLWLLWLLDTMATIATMATLATLDYGYTGYYGNYGYFSPIRSGLLCPANVLLLLLGRPLNCQNWKGLGNFKMWANPNDIMRDACTLSKLCVFIP